jgi:soluble lytic murein transglycosylase
VKVNARLLLLILFLAGFVSSVFVISGPIGTAHREKVKKQKVISKIIDYIQDENVALEEVRVRTISERVYEESIQYNVDYRLILALMKVESNFRHDAISKRGARGLMQVRPTFAKYTAEHVGINWQGEKTLDEPEKNIKIGVHIFSKLIEDFQGVNMALHAYHVGPTRLRGILYEKKIPQKRYLNLVLNEYDRNLSLLPAP